MRRRTSAPGGGGGVPPPVEVGPGRGLLKSRGRANITVFAAAGGAAHVGPGQRGDVHAADEDAPGLRFVEALEQREHRGLARAGEADEGGAGAGRDGEGEAAQREVGRAEVWT